MLTVTAPPESAPTTLQKHLLATYFTMRLGLGILAVAFPFWLAIVGWVYAGLPLQDSMSAYYHAVADERSMRTWFVGILFALGVLLYLYKGFSVRENVALNIAGIATVMVAVFPMAWGPDASTSRFSMHGASAIVAFLAIAFVGVFCCEETLRLIQDPDRRARFQKTYLGLAAVMIVSPLAAFVISQIMGLSNRFIFLAETFGLIAFAAFWITKVREMRATQADLLALDGTLIKGTPSPSDVRLAPKAQQVGR
jgi:hypothetical protein